MKIARRPKQVSCPYDLVAGHRDYRKATKWQTKALVYACKTRNPAFFLEMRLGKNLVVIRWVRWLQRQEGRPLRVLILGPITPLSSWIEELPLEHEPSVQAIFNMNSGQRAQALRPLSEFDLPTRILWDLANYEMYRSSTTLQNLPYDVIVCDESVKLKNPQAKLTKALIRNRHRSKHKAILSGMPNPEGALDLVCQMLWLDGYFLGCDNYWKFRARYAKQEAWSPMQWIVPVVNWKTIRQVLKTRAFVYTQKEAGVGATKRYEQVYCKPSKQFLKQYKEIVRNLEITMPDGRRMSTKYVMVARMWLQRLCGGFSPAEEDHETELLDTTKVDNLLSLLQGRYGGKQAVVWFKFRAELFLVEQYCKDAGISTVKILGGVSKLTRSGISKQFREGEYQVLLATEKCGKYGLDLSTANVEIYYSNEWSCDDRVQSEERINHLRKTGNVIDVIDLVMQGTVDQEVVMAVRQKKFDAKYLLDAAMRDV